MMRTIATILAVPVICMSAGIGQAVAGFVPIVVTADTGGPVSGVQAQIESSSFGAVGAARNAPVANPFKGNGVTNSEGMLVFTVPDGMYEVKVTYMGNTLAKHSKASTSASQPLPFVVPKSKVASQPFFITNNKSEAISGAAISITQNNKTITTATTDNEGAVAVPLIAGSYVAQVTAKGKTLSQAFVTSKGSQLIRINMDGPGNSRPIKTFGR